MLKGIAIMAMVSIAAGLFLAATMPKAQPGDHYTAMYMSTGAIDRNITKNHTTLAIPFYVENHEGSQARYDYNVSILYKDTIFHPGADAWSEDLNVDEEYDAARGSITVAGGDTQKVLLDVPVHSDQKWRYANVTISLYKDGTQGTYRSLRLWAINQVK